MSSWPNLHAEARNLRMSPKTPVFFLAVALIAAAPSTSAATRCAAVEQAVGICNLSSCRNLHTCSTPEVYGFLAILQAHTTCVTESQKYAEGATKPGGFAAKGFFEAAGGTLAPAVPAAARDPADDEFLAKRPPWRCRQAPAACINTPQ